MTYRPGPIVTRSDDGLLHMDRNGASETFDCTIGVIEMFVNDHNAMQRRLNAVADVLRRATDPDNYDEDFMDDPCDGGVPAVAEALRVALEHP